MIQLIFKFILWCNENWFFYLSPYLEKFGYSWMIKRDYKRDPYHYGVQIMTGKHLRIWTEPCGKSHKANSYCKECFEKYGNNQKDEQVGISQK